MQAKEKHLPLILKTFMNLPHLIFHFQYEDNNYEISNFSPLNEYYFHELRSQIHFNFKLIIIPSFDFMIAVYSFVIIRLLCLVYCKEKPKKTLQGV